MTRPEHIIKAVVRAMREEDLDQVLAIENISFSLPWPEKAYSYELLENQNSLLWVAEVTLANGTVKIIGSIVIWIILDELHIATLAIHPEYRGMGFAKELITAALFEGVERGVQIATLEVRLSNTRAQTLYSRFGFRKAGRRKRYYRDNSEDAIIMTLDNLKNFRAGTNTTHRFETFPMQN
jgi:ribosomal-protein-alanine N-acetyltransferase